MGFAVFHAEKITASGASLGAHIDRQEGQEHTYTNADPARKLLNKQWLITPHCQKPLHTALSDRIKEGYTGNTAIRRDAVKGLSLIMTGSHEQMKALEKSPEKFKQWINANYKFIEQEFGKDNVVRFVLHLDEKTPHLHAVVVPLQEGRLSAKKVLGDRIQMSKRQDRYAQLMEPFALSRGIRGSKAIHNSEGWYIGQQQAEKEAILSDLPKMSIIDRLNPSAYEEDVSNRFKSLVKEKKDVSLEIDRREQQIKTLQRQIDNLQKEKNTTTATLGILRKGLVTYIKHHLGRELKEEEKQVIEIHSKAYQEREEKAIQEKLQREEQQEVRKNRGMRR